MDSPNPRGLGRSPPACRLSIGRRGVNCLAAFWISFFFVLIAEMGDKTQLVALAFATRYRTSVVVTGVFVATLLVHLFSVGLGEAAGAELPRFWVQLLTGLAFIGFGLWTLRGDKLDSENLKESRWGPLATVGVTFFIAELGDKTMLTTVTIASQQQAFVPVWIGSTLGMVVADGAAIAVGRLLGKKLPDRVIRFSAAAIFIASGLITLAMAFR